VRGIGEQLSDPLELPRLPAVLVNPAVPLATKQVFAQLDARGKLEPGIVAAGRPLRPEEIPRDRAKLVAFLKTRGNALEGAAISLEPVVADVLAALQAIDGCELARMSGSGATCFGIFTSARGALAAARALRASRPRWWAHATMLG
jgi:4-diphosphocytidyl-2-C-methyl-D-erythritol kinase